MYPQDTWSRIWQGGFSGSIDRETNRVSVGADLLEAFKSHARITGTQEDTDLADKLNRAVRDWEDDCERLLIQATVTEYFDEWPWDRVPVLQLRLAPLVSVSAIQYYDADGVQQTWDSANYEVDAINEPGRIVVADTATLTSPAIDQRPNCVSVAYVTGLASDYTAIDPQTRQAIFVRAAWLCGPGREPTPEYDPAAVGRCWAAEIGRQVWKV